MATALVSERAVKSHSTALVSKRAYSTPNFAIPLPDREDVQERLTASCHHEGGQPLSDIDMRILELLLESPLKKPNPCKERFMLYEAIIDIYRAATTGMIPAHFGVEMLQNCDKRRVYLLLFNALYHYEVLEGILIESSFFSSHLSLHGTGMLLYIMLFDYQDLNFSIPFHRLPEKIDCISDAIPKIARALAKHKTKLNSALARMCVQSSVPTISQLIPDNVTRECFMMTSFSPCFARVNEIKCSQDHVLKRLLTDGYKTVSYLSDLRNRTKSFCIINANFLGFSADCRKLLDTEVMVLEGYLVLQDMMSYMSVKRIEEKIQACDGDILITEPNSGYEIAHIATLLGFERKVFVFDSTKDGSLLAKARITTLGLTNVVFTDTSFASITCEEDVLREVQMVICVPETVPCTRGNNVDLAMQEGDRMLPFLVKQTGDNVSHLMTDNILKSCLSTALALKRKYVLYMTRSDSLACNENIVTKQLEKFNRIPTVNNSTRYELVSTIPYSNNSYFIAIIEQEVPPEVTPSMVIARAIANGLIDGDEIGENKQIKRTTTRTKSKKSIKPFKASLSTTISYQQKCVSKKEKGQRDYHKPTFKF